MPQPRLVKFSTSKFLRRYLHKRRSVKHSVCIDSRRWFTAIANIGSEMTDAGMKSCRSLFLHHRALSTQRTRQPVFPSDAGRRPKFEIATASHTAARPPKPQGGPNLRACADSAPCEPRRNQVMKQRISGSYPCGKRGKVRNPYNPNIEVSTKAA